MDSRASLLDLKGPYDVHQPLPWDSHVYPVDYPSLEQAQALWQRSRDIAEWMASAWAAQGRSGPDNVPVPTRPGNLPPLPVIPGQGQTTLSDPAALGLDASLRTAGREGLATALWDLVSKGHQLKLYTDWLKGAGIRYFEAPELTRHRWRHTSRVQPGDSGAWSSLFLVLPPEVYSAGIWPILPKCIVPEPRLWPSILPALRILDRFRHYLGEPVQGVSGYRLPWYNAQINGSANSYHMHNCAIDFSYKARTKSNEIDASIFYRFYRSLYEVKGDGIGVYDSFIHLDVGLARHTAKGRALRWYSRNRDIRDVFDSKERFSVVG